MPDTTLDTNTSVTALHGVAMGGQQPIVAAHVYMFEAHNDTQYGLYQPTANPVTYGTAPTSLLGASGGYSCTFPLSTDGNGLCYYKTTGTDPSGAPSNIVPGATDGSFYLNHTYACTPGDEVWLLSLSGYTTTSGGAQALNPYAGLMAALGQCPAGGNFSSDSFIFMNELSTVAMAYAIAGFAGPTTASHYGTSMVISTSATNATGFQQAFANAGQLYNIFQNNPATNQPDQSAPHLTPVGHGIPPYYLLNTVADMLASCINSAIIAAPTNCANLFSGAYGNSSQVTDTASAAIQIAQVPNAPGLQELLALSTTNGPWFPNNTTNGAPYSGLFPELTAAISYTIPATGGNISGNITPSGVAVDGSGNVFTDAFNGDGYMVKVNSLGVVTSSTSGTPYIADSTALALDSTGLVWADGYDLGNVYEVSSASNLMTVTNFGSTPLSKSMDHPVAADSVGDVFFADTKLSELYWIQNGTVHNPIANSQCTTGVNGVAVDSTNNLWVTSNGPVAKYYTVVCRISEASSPTIYASVGNNTSPQKVYEADGVAVDSGNNGWIYDNSDAIVFKVSSTGTTASSPINGGGIKDPTGIAIDGLNNVFVQNSENFINGSTGGSITEYNSAGASLSPENNGFQSANVNAPNGIAIDISGNIWIANYGNTNLLEVIGGAAPTAGPLSSGKPGTRP